MAVITQQQYQDLYPGPAILHLQHFSGSYSPVTLGCNPTSSAITAALGTATATDGCGAVTNITFSDAPATTAGCVVTQVRTFTAVDGCNNSATISRSVSLDQRSYTSNISGTYSPVTLGCNPLPTDITAALGFCICY
jgi:hypothetical protein